VDRAGLMVELVDVCGVARPFADFELPVPSARRYEAHNRATLLRRPRLPGSDAKRRDQIFADGAQVFRLP